MAEVPQATEPTNASEGAISTSAAKARVRSNVAANVGRLLLQTGIGIWFTPYLIAHLGVAVFGLIPLATQMTSYIGLLTIAVSGAVGRFLTVDLARGDDDSANKTFNTALFAYAALSLILLPVGVGLAYAGPLFLSVPEGHEWGARWLLLGAAGGFILATLGGIFAVSTFAHSRFDLGSGIETLSLLVRVGVVVAAFSILGPRLEHVGAGVFLAAVIALVGFIWAWKRLTPQLHVRLRDFDHRRLRALLGMGGWMAVGSMGWLLYQNVDLVVLNTMVSARDAGLYAPILQWNTLLRTLCGTLAAVLTPTVIAYHARGDDEGMVRVSLRAVKLLGLFMALPVGLVCGLSRPLLITWLGEEFAPMSTVMWIVIAPLSIALAVSPLGSMYTALNRVKVPGLVSIAQGALNLTLMLALVASTSEGALAVAISKSTALLLGVSAFVPVYCARITGTSVWVFIKAMAWPAIWFAVVAGAGHVLAWQFGLQSWAALGSTSAIVAVAYLGLVYRIGLSKRERDEVVSLVLKRA